LSPAKNDLGGRVAAENQHIDRHIRQLVQQRFIVSDGSQAIENVAVRCRAGLDGLWNS
jgi:hypothetical protein